MSQRRPRGGPIATEWLMGGVVCGARASDWPDLGQSLRDGLGRGPAPTVCDNIEVDLDVNRIKSAPWPGLTKAGALGSGQSVRIARPFRTALGRAEDRACGGPCVVLVRSREHPLARRLP